MVIIHRKFLNPTLGNWFCSENSLDGFYFSPSLTFYSSLIEIQFTYHTIHPLKVYNSIVFSILREFCKRYHNWSPFLWNNTMRILVRMPVRSAHRETTGQREGSSCNKRSWSLSSSCPNSAQDIRGNYINQIVKAIFCMSNCGRLVMVKKVSYAIVKMKLRQYNFLR